MEISKQTEKRMKNSFEHLLSEYAKLRTGRANVAIFDDVKIDYYGAQTPIKQLCNISIPEPRLIIIQPWDKTIISSIEKAILSSNVGITPESDGTLIRLPCPSLTEEKRKEVVKQVKKMSEETKISIRNIRRDTNETLKKMKKLGELPEDKQNKLLKEIQELTDSWIKKVIDATTNKEKDLMFI